MALGLSRTLVLVAGLLAAGCMVSDQKGQLVPDGNPRYWDQKLGEVSFKRLSWEQRQSVWKAIAVRAALVERK